MKPRPDPGSVAVQDDGAAAIAHDQARPTAELERQLQALQAENARLRAVIQTTTDAILILDADSIVRFANPAAEQLFGRSAEKLVGTPFGFPVIVGDTAELDIVRPDGRELVAELRVGESRWDGQPARIASLRDCTERRKADQRERDLIREQVARAEAVLAERIARFLVDAGASFSESLDTTHVLRTLADVAVPFLADWAIVDALDNDHAFKRVAVAHADPAHSDVAETLRNLDLPQPLGDDGPPVSALLLTEFDTAARQRLPTYLVPSIEPLQPRSVMTVPLVARGRTTGNITLVSTTSDRNFHRRDFMVAEELASRAAIAADNARLYQEAQQANRVKSDFLAVMSHELRTPLNAVIGYSDLLLMGVPTVIPPEATHHVNRIRASAKHLLRLIEEVLTYTRIEAGRERLDLERFDPKSLIHEVVSVITPSVGPAVRLICDLPEQTITIESDPTKLQQILLNLLSNAVKFTEQGEVGIRLRFDASQAHFEIWDTGIGIDESNFERVFEPFWQAEQSRTRRADGTGLGLTVARKLAGLLGAEIRFRSLLHHGTRFLISLPLVHNGSSTLAD